MRVDVLRKRLSREENDEEVVFIVPNDDDDGGMYYEVINEPFLHGGPASFYNDAKGERFIKSVTIIRLRKKK